MKPGDSKFQSSIFLFSFAFQFKTSKATSPTRGSNIKSNSTDFFLASIDDQVVSVPNICQRPISSDIPTALVYSKFPLWQRIFNPSSPKQGADDIRLFDPTFDTILSRKGNAPVGNPLTQTSVNIGGEHFANLGFPTSCVFDTVENFGQIYTGTLQKYRLFIRFRTHCFKNNKNICHPSHRLQLKVRGLQV